MAMVCEAGTTKFIHVWQLAVHIGLSRSEQVSSMSIARHHAEWLSLIEVSGPFLSMPVLLQVFPQGLDAHDPELSRLLRMAYDEWADNQAGARPDPAIHTQWLRFVLVTALEMPRE